MRRGFRFHDAPESLARLGPRTRLLALLGPVASNSSCCPPPPCASATTAVTASTPTPVENAIRPFCLGRRNWLFSDTVADANASARLYSLIDTAKANRLEPYAYLRHVFTELPKAQSLADIEALLQTRLDPAALARTPSKAPPSTHVNSAVSGAVHTATAAFAQRRTKLARQAIRLRLNTVVHPPPEATAAVREAGVMCPIVLCTTVRGYGRLSPSPRHFEAARSLRRASQESPVTNGVRTPRRLRTVTATPSTRSCIRSSLREGTSRSRGCAGHGARWQP